MTLLELLQSQRPMSAMGQMPNMSLAGMLGIGSAQAAPPQIYGTAGVGPDTVVRSGAAGAPAAPVNNPNVTAGRAAQTPQQIEQLAQMLAARGIPLEQARAMAMQKAQGR